MQNASGLQRLTIAILGSEEFTDGKERCNRVCI